MYTSIVHILHTVWCKRILLSEEDPKSEEDKCTSKRWHTSFFSLLLKTIFKEKKTVGLRQSESTLTFPTTTTTDENEFVDLKLKHVFFLIRT